MKNTISIFFFIVMGLVTMITNGCQKEEGDEKQLPSLTTSDVIKVTQKTALCGGNITSNGGSQITVRGICWSTSSNPTITDNISLDDSGLGKFTSPLVNLSPNTTYYVRAYATNDQGTTYGNQMTFSTVTVNLPVLTTTTVTSIAISNATSGGNIISDGGANITARGICWSTSQNPLITDNHTEDGSGTGVFTGLINGLTKGTIYYLRAFATNEAGTSYGNEMVFKTYDVMDFDGNLYTTVQIGTQVWMKENLKTTHYRDGSEILNITDEMIWSSSKNGAYSWYKNDINQSNNYGALYNYYAVIDNRRLCPEGWHIPTKAEWETLNEYLGGENGAGDKLKEDGTTHWISNRYQTTNETEFTALPGGYRSYMGPFYYLGERGYWWSTTEYASYDTWIIFMFGDNKSSYTSPENKRFGFSVRCIKD